MNVNRIFSAFLAIEELSFVDNDELVNYAYFLKENDPGVAKSNFYGWQSNILTVPNDQIAILVESIQERAEILKKQCNFKVDTKAFLNNLWININQRSSFNRPHIHLNCVFSGVYYVKCSSNSGKLVFRHPSLVQQCSVSEEVVDDFSDYNASTISVDPSEGKLIIFPSWLEHYVESNIDDEDRISIAFNIDIKRDDQ